MRLFSYWLVIPKGGSYAKQLAVVPVALAALAARGGEPPEYRWPEEQLR